MPLVVVDPAATTADRREAMQQLRAAGVDGPPVEVTQAGPVDDDTYWILGDDATAAALLPRLWAEGPRRLILAIVPLMPSGLHHTFGMPKDREAVLARLLSADRYSIDVGWCVVGVRRHWFLNSLLLGPSPLRLPARLRRWRPGRVRLEAPGRTVTVEGATLVTVMNGQFLRDGTNLAPRALLVDADLDVQVWSVRPNGSRWQRAGPGRHLREDWLRRFSASRVASEVPREWIMRLDERIVLPPPTEIGVEAGLVDLLI